jgi:hypothetical protein
MANNLFAGTPHSGTGLQEKAFSLIPEITTASIAIIYKVGSPLRSYVPGRSINAINKFEANGGYYIIPKQNLDLTAYITPPLPTGSDNAIEWEEGSGGGVLEGE